MFSLSLPTVATLFLVYSTAVRASPCITFDTNWNLLAFGLDGKDWNAGTQDTWGSGTATDITTSGRPPFDGTNTTCFLSEYTNAIYVTNGDSSSLSSIHIYDATAKSWSTQAVTTGSFDPSSFNAILDHDTNVFYALSHGELFRLDMGLMKAASSTPLQWVDIEQAPYPSSYVPVMALAQNHIFFLNVPGVPAGSADIFVIHFNYWQPEAQAFPAPSGTIPATYGQTASFFENLGVQLSFAFVPQDSSATYVLNVETNTTQILAGPSTKDPNAVYYASTSALVQLDSKGDVSYLLVNTNDTSANAAATWNSVVPLANSAPPSSTTPTSGSASASGSAAKSTGTSKLSSSSNSNSSSASAANGAVTMIVPGGVLGGLVSAAMLVCAAVLF